MRDLNDSKRKISPLKPAQDAVIVDTSKVNKKKKYNAHDEKNKYKNGDKVLIRECKPYSKSKKFEVIGDSK